MYSADGALVKKMDNLESCVTHREKARDEYGRCVVPIENVWSPRKHVEQPSTMGDSMGRHVSWPARGLKPLPLNCPDKIRSTVPPNTYFWVPQSHPQNAFNGMVSIGDHLL